MGRLDGEVALVTGASSGIGAGPARMLAGHGAAVALAARREEELRRVAGTIGAAGGSALVVPADVERDADLGALPGRVHAELGPVDILAGDGPPTPMTDDAPETAHRVVGVVDGLLLQDVNVKMGPEILMRTMRNPWD